MRNIQNIIICSFAILTLIRCNNKQEISELKETNGWKKDSQVLKTIENIKFTFPDSGYAFENKENFVKQSFNAMKENSKTIGLNKFTDTIFIRFLLSRNEMKKYTGTKGGGAATTYTKTLFVVANENEKPPLTHELMHLMSTMEWGYPARSSDWMNEGLGTFAADNCNGYNVAQIYRYFLENDKLISMDLLSSDFYKHPEMVGYHQSGYIVEYLLSYYNIEQFKKLWTDGFENFKEIYDVPFSKVKADLEKYVMKKYPIAPEIDFEKFSKGCK